mgnify:CR=1 FL=1
MHVYIRLCREEIFCRILTNTLELFHEEGDLTHIGLGWCDGCVCLLSKRIYSKVYMQFGHKVRGYGYYFSRVSLFICTLHLGSSLIFNISSEEMAYE